MRDPNIAFVLRVQLYNPKHDKRTVTITAFDDLPCDNRGAYRLTCEVKHGSKVIFPKGQLTCALSPGRTTDGIHARELIMDLVGMAPDAGTGVDDDYWEGYTPEQIEWVNEHWEAISCERQARYCDDETGSVDPRKGRW